MEGLMSVVEKINGALWNHLLLFFLVGSGIWFTFKLKFIQVRGMKYGWKRTFGGIFKKAKTEGGISQFQALSAAIAAQIGTGNLAGAATAIAMGGPGAIFWMWLSAFFGMATIYVEAILAQKYRVVGEDGKVTGGPVYYIKAAFKGPLGKILAAIFSVLIIFALGFMGNAVQANSIGSAFNTAFGLNPLYVGIAIAALSFLIFSGGVKRIVSFTEKVVPIMAVFYILGSLIVVFVNFKQIPVAFYEIIVGAFDPQAIAGGVIGATVKEAVKRGVARGLFSNEAGMGSTPHAHAIAEVDHPSQQGCVAMVGVLVDTFIVLNLTALVIITTRSVTPDASLTGVALTQVAFSSVFGGFGNVFIAICMLLFAFSTIIGWYFFGESNIKYVFGKKGVFVYGLLVCVCIVLGSLAEVPLVWEMTDCFNGLMVIPNLLGLLALTKVAVELDKDFSIFRKKPELKD